MLLKDLKYAFMHNEIVLTHPLVKTYTRTLSEFAYLAYNETTIHAISGPQLIHMAIF